MGSVIDYIECPNCKHEAYSDFYYKTGEEYVNCQNCGYHYSATLKRDDDGEFVTKDGTNNYALDNLILEINELKEPYGSYRLKVYESHAVECGSFENEEQANEAKRNVMEMDIVEYFAISRFVNNEIILSYIIDNGPKVDGAGYSEEDRDWDNTLMDGIEDEDNNNDNDE